MPPDSTYVLDNLSDTSALPDSLRSVLRVIDRDGSIDHSTSSIPGYSPPANNGIPWGTINVIFVSLSVYVLIKYLRYRFLTKKLDTIYEEKRPAFHSILEANNPYYKSLGAANQDRFIQRTILFMQSKKFTYVGLDEEEKMPLLISATAIQLTFGLKNFLLDYFDNIYVMRGNYRYGLSAVPYEGHVNDYGIYLSWDNFLREYSDYSDGENVGLHEMAHALAYVNFNVSDGKDDSFQKKFYEFSPIARPIFNNLQKAPSTFLNNYAATTYEEFWAVCIESFFERPFQFREQMPALYSALCSLLNQDPITRDKILSSSELA